MKTDTEIRDDVYQLVKNSRIMDAVNGKLCARLRPLDSTAEDVVISVQANTPGDPQKAFVLVDIYVKDVKVNGRNEEDTARIRELSRIAYDALQSNTQSDYYATISEQRTYAIEATGEHLIQTRLRYRHVQEA